MAKQSAGLASGPRPSSNRLEILTALQRKTLWLASWTIHLSLIHI